MNIYSDKLVTEVKYYLQLRSSIAILLENALYATTTHRMLVDSPDVLDSCIIYVERLCMKS